MFVTVNETVLHVNRVVRFTVNTGVKNSKIRT